jgi:hypothetical protein
MQRKMVANGTVVLQNRSFHYECWSNNSDIIIKMFHNGKSGNSSEFVRKSKGGLKVEMEQSLIDDKVLVAFG